MRNSFVKKVREEMRRDKDIFFLTGDLGFNALESLQKEFPDRFINAGIAEANMIGVTAGLALTGKKVIVYSIASFATMRAYEQVRDDVCYHNLPVKIAGTGGGYNYASHGVTHHAVEDIAIMSALPGMKVFAPSYSWEAEEATTAMLKDDGPAYIRLGKSPAVDYSKPNFSFKIGRGFIIRDGNDLLLAITGNILDNAIKIADILKEKAGLETCVISLPTIKPLDKKLLLEKAATAKLVATMEEGGLYGGLGSQVAMLLSQSVIPKKPFLAFGTPDFFVKDVGGRDFLLKKAGLDPREVAENIMKQYRK